MKYLELTYWRLMRGRLAPGQEADVVQLFRKGHSNPNEQTTLRDHLLHALERFALARRTPDKVIPFDV